MLKEDIDSYTTKYNHQRLDCSIKDQKAMKICIYKIQTTKKGTKLIKICLNKAV